MSQADSYNDKMREMTDEELYEMLYHDKNYVPEAILAAKHELETRNLTPERSAEIEDILKQQDEKNAVLASIPLQWAIRILMLIFSFGIIQAIFGESHRNRGYQRKYRECWTWMKYGLFFWVSLTILLFLIALITDKFKI
jgi:hypothetical protein